MKKIVIIGAGGHGAVAADIARLSGYSQIIFLDDEKDCAIPGYVLAGKVQDYSAYLDDWDFFVAIGNCRIREKIQKMLIDRCAVIATLIHPNAVIGSFVEIGAGSFLAAGTVVNPGAKLGEGVIVNTCASIDHDCAVGAFSHVAVGAHLCGTVQIGERTWIGAGATVINNITVCADSMVGAGAVVVRSISSAGTYIGVPAQKAKNETH